jgi:hypothetical protein
VIKRLFANRKSIIIIIAIPPLLVVGIAAYFFTSQTKLGPQYSARCEGLSLRLPNISGSTSAALPPGSEQDLELSSKYVFSGRVTEVLKTYSDGDEVFCATSKKLGSTDWEGGGTENSQDILVSIDKEIKGSFSKKEIRIKKGVNSVLFKVGDSGKFFVDREGKFIGEYFVKN